MCIEKLHWTLKFYFWVFILSKSSKKISKDTLLRFSSDRYCRSGKRGEREQTKLHYEEIIYVNNGTTIWWNTMQPQKGCAFWYVLIRKGLGDILLGDKCRSLTAPSVLWVSEAAFFKFWFYCLLVCGFEKADLFFLPSKSLHL